MNGQTVVFVPFFGVEKENNFNVCIKILSTKNGVCELLLLFYERKITCV